MRTRFYRIYISRRDKNIVKRKNRLLTPHQRRWRGLHEAPPLGSSPLIFSNTALQKPAARVMWTMVTLAIWTGWIYLWLPLLLLLNWQPNNYAKYDHRASPTIKFENFKFFIIYSIVILCTGVILAIRLTIKIKKTRRQQNTQPTSPTTEQLATFTNMQAEDLVNSTRYRRILAHHDSHGRLQSIENLDSPQELPSKLDPVKKPS